MQKADEATSSQGDDRPTHHPTDDEFRDIVLEDENESPADAMRKLRERLTKCTQEKQEYLDGWQRSKADFINTKREFGEKLGGAQEHGKDALARELGPVLDALDAALQSDEHSSGKLTEGVRNIAAKLISILRSIGIELYGAPGDPFDPRLHEPIGAEDPPEQSLDQAVAKVHQRGLRRGDHIIRHATVTIYQRQELGSRM